MSGEIVSFNDQVKKAGVVLNRMRPDFEAVLPKFLTPEKMVGLALSALRREPKLLECSPQSFVSCILQSAQLGLEPNTPLQHAFLIPYAKECTFQLGYRGMLQLAYRSGKVAKVVARVVCENDEWDLQLGSGEFVRHQPFMGGKRGDPVAVYCVVTMRDGTESIEVMSFEQVEEVRSSSKAGKSGPWYSHWEEMAKKTVFRRCCKWLPVSADMLTAVTIDEQADAGIRQSLPEARIEVLEGFSIKEEGEGRVSPLDALADSLAPPPSEEKRKEEPVVDARGIKRLWAVAREVFGDEADGKLHAILMDKYGLDSVKKIPVRLLEEVLLSVDPSNGEGRVGV